MNVRLSTAIFACLGLTAGSAVVVLGGAQMTRTNRLIRDHSFQQQAATAEALAHQVEHLVELELRSVEALAAVIDGQVDELQPARLKPILRQHQERFSETDVVMVGNPEGKALVLSPEKYSRGVGKSYSDRDYFKALVRHRRSVVSRVQLGRRTRRPNIHAAAPIGRDEIRGFVVMGYDVEEIARVASRAVERLPEGRALVLDWERRVVVDTRFPAPKTVVSLRSSPFLKSAASKAAEARQGRLDPDGPQLLGAVSRAEVGPRSWSVYVTQPSAVIDREVEGMRLEVLVVTLMVLAMTALAALLVARWVAAPITRLASVAKAFGDGAFHVSFDSDAEVYRPREARYLELALCDMQERIKRHTEELEDKVRARTQALEQARNAALASSKHKSEFIANMSHEIRTPMNGVLGNIQLLADTADNPEQQELVRTAQISALALLEILNDILDFSKLDANQLQLESLPFSLWDEVFTVVETFGALASQQSLELVVRIRPQTPTDVVGDPGRFRQILSNLVGNALKFTPKGSVTIDISSPRALSDRANLQVKVVDTGIGIPEDRLDGIFDDFAQVDGSTTRKYGGTGLGLAIVRRLAELMRGGVRVESRLGVGSVFIVDVALEQNEEATPNPRLNLSGRPPGTVAIFSKASAHAVALREQLQFLGVRAQVYSEQIQLDELAECAGGLSAVIVDEELDVASFARVPRVRWVGLGQTPRSDRGCKPDVMLMRPARIERVAEVLRQAWDMSEGPNAGQVSKTGLRGRVLVVDDNTVNRRVLKRMLEVLGLDVEMAEDGRQALEAAQEAAFDIILMDCQMPVMDGYEATRKIRRLPGPTGQVPVVALTANASDENRMLCLEAGMNEHMAKPVVKGVLIAMLCQFLERPRADLHDEAPAYQSTPFSRSFVPTSTRSEG